MPSLDNIDNLLDSGSENFNYLPQGLSLEDADQALYDYFDNFEFSTVDSTGIAKKVKIIYLTQELWAERKFNWKLRLGENGEEVMMPFMTLARTSASKGTSPFKYTIPNKKKFKFVKIPKFDGTLKGFDIYKIPQPVYVDLSYELRFVSHYQEDVNLFYEKIFRDVFSDAQLYLKINGYYISCVSEEPSEENDIDPVNSERIYQTVFPIKMHYKLIDSTKFEKVSTINKITIKITEKK